jgi:hypothetical protein
MFAIIAVMNNHEGNDFVYYYATATITDSQSRHYGRLRGSRSYAIYWDKDYHPTWEGVGVG